MDILDKIEHWKKDDPRDTIYKRANIIILRPHISGHGWEAGTGDVETKNSYCIWTFFENHPFFAEGDKWDKDWLWCRAPDRN
jgi:hypothetical protein